MLTRLITTYLFSLADLFLTVRLVRKYGFDVEANPFGRWMLQDPVRLVLFKVIAIAVALFVLWIFRERLSAKIASWVVAIAFLALVLYHVGILIRLGGR